MEVRDKRRNGRAHKRMHHRQPASVGSHSPPSSLLLSLSALCRSGFVPVYLYPRSVIDNPPTVKAGHLSIEDEAKNRALACLLIAKAGRMLTLSVERRH